LNASYITSAAATEALSEVIFPLIGICAMKSHFFLTSSDNPLPSLPMTIAVGDLKSILLYSSSATAVYAMIQRLLFLSVSMAWAMLETLATGIYHTAPADALATVAVRPGCSSFPDYHTMNAAGISSPQY